MEFGYTAPAGARTERRVDPYQLVATGRRWYLMAFDVDRDDWRSFRLDRMEDVRAGTWRFTRREHPDAAAYVQRSVTVSSYPHQARVLVHAPAEAVRRLTTPASATIEEVDDHSCLLLSGSQSLDALALHIGMLGWDFEVLEPAALREVVAMLGARLTRAAVS